MPLRGRRIDIAIDIGIYIYISVAMLAQLRSFFCTCWYFINPARASFRHQSINPSFNPHRRLHLQNSHCQAAWQISRRASKRPTRQATCARYPHRQNSPSQYRPVTWSKLPRSCSFITALHRRYITGTVLHQFSIRQCNGEMGQIKA